LKGEEMSLITLKDLEGVAKAKFEEQADKWTRAIAEHEGVGFEELRPYLVSLYHHPGYQVDVVFVIPKHTPIKLSSKYSPYTPGIAKLEDGKLVGDYNWYVFKTHTTGSVSFHGVDGLGHALLLARWAYEEDKRAKWA